MSRPGRWRRLAALAAAGFLAAGCVAGAEPGSSGTPAPGTGFVSVTTTVPPTTIGPAGTTPPPTSVPETPPTLPATTSTLPPATTTTRGAWWREITSEAPLGVWVIGDSLAGPTGSALAALGQATGLLATRVDFQSGTGLASPGFFDWPAFAREGRAGADPEAVVVLLGANDAQGMASPAGWLDFATPEWDARYAAVLGEFMDLLAADGTRVYWVGAPIMAGPAYDARMRHINTVLRVQAALRLNVRYLDAYRLFQGPDGEYASALPDEAGDLVAVRASDGIHFTPAGAARLAKWVAEVLATDWEFAGAWAG